jgi:HK97 family phage major capsid protein
MSNIPSRVKYHPHTGKLLGPIGYRRNGSPIWPILGASPDDSSNDPKGPVLTHSQSINRLKEIETELERLAELNELSPEDELYFQELTREFGTTDNHRKRLERAAELKLVRSAANGLTATSLRTERGSNGGGTDSGADDTLEPDSVSDRRFKNPWNLGDMRTYGRSQGEVGAELRSRALSAIERMPHATDKVREAATILVDSDDSKNSRLANLCLATSSPEYMRAFTKLVRTQGQVATLTQDEAAAYERAMSLTDSAGGYLVPFQLDPTVILTANGSRNQIRQIARVVQATGDVWNGISSAGVTGSWDAEAAEVSDDSPTFAQPTIPVYKGSVFVPISIEAQQDEQGVAQEIAKMIAFEKDRMESVAFITGSGSGEPTGIVTALTGTGSVVNSATTDTFASADVYALDSALPDRYAANADWIGHRAVYNLVRRFDTQGGSNLWGYIGEARKAELLGRPAYTAEAMDSTVTALAANPLLIFGDFENYVIADRVGTTIEYIPHLFGANRRPTGQRGWYAYFRVGADSVNDGAFRMLDVT